LNHAVIISIIPNRFVKILLFILQLEIMPSHYESYSYPLFATRKLW
jgi:hypothetical protein